MYREILEDASTEATQLLAEAVGRYTANKMPQKFADSDKEQGESARSNRVYREILEDASTEATQLLAEAVEFMRHFYHWITEAAHVNPPPKTTNKIRSPCLKFLVLAASSRAMATAAAEVLPKRSRLR